MAKPDGPRRRIMVESYIPASTSGKHGRVHIRPVAGFGYPTHLAVQCPKVLNTAYPVGTRFWLWVRLTDRQGSGEFLTGRSGGWEVVDEAID
jgi:hypothetical protein